MFDAHCHLDRSEEPVADILQRARQQGVNKMLVAGVEPKGWAEQNRLAGEDIYVAWGLHPWAVASRPKQVSDGLRLLDDMLRTRPVPAVALGETGLDYGRRMSKESRPHQIHAFRAQVHLAQRYKLPLVLHIVSAHKAALEILRSETLPEPAGMIHAFSGSPETALEYVALGFHISFCGSVVDPNHRKARKAAAAVPADRLLVETDAPDQTPITRHPSPNEPAFLIDVIAAIAEIRGEEPAHVARVTTQNAERLFCRR